MAIVESASRLTEDDTDEGGMDFFAVDLAGGATRLLTASVTGQADGSSYFAGFTPGGAAILQSNIALTAEDEDGYDWDVYSVDLASSAKTLLTATVPEGAEGFSQAMRFTEDGRILFVGSRAALTADDQDEGAYDLYAVDLTTGDKTLLDSDPDAAISPVGFSLGTYP